MIELPKSLGSVESLIKRYDKACEHKDRWSNHMRECYHYAIPHRDTFYYNTPGQKKNVHIFDSTACIATQKFASRMQATLVPPWRRWAVLAPGNEIPENEQEDVARELEEQTKILYNHLNHSNFATQMPEAFLDLAVSTGIIDLEEGSGDSLLEFTAVPLADVCLEEGPRGTIESRWRLHKMAARNVQRVWPTGDISAALQKKVTDSPDEEVEIVTAILYDAEAQIYHNVALEKDQKHVVFYQAYEVSPSIAFRENVAPGEIYGRGRLMTLLPDIKTANKMVEFILRNAAMAVGGVYTTTDKGTLNPYTMRLKPPAVIPVKSNDRANPSLRALERSGDINFTDLVLEDIRGRINKTMFAEPFGDINDTPVKSATEIALRNQELVKDSGSAFGRMQTELTEPLIRRAVHILQKNGKMAPIRVDGKEVTIKFVSPLARAQDQEDITAFSQYLEIGMAIGQEVFMLGTKIEDIPAWLAAKLGVDLDLTRNKQERQALTDKVTEILAALQAQQQGGQPGG